MSHALSLDPTSATKSSRSKRTSRLDSTLRQLIAKNNQQPFTTEQLAAITFDMHTHLRIIAGAGSGKTQTICAKAAYLVLEKKVPPEKIMLCTFSRKAKLEMAQRVQLYLPEKKLAVKTFHGWFNAEFHYLSKKYPTLKHSNLTGMIDEDHYQQTIQQLIKKYRLYNFDKFEDRTIVTRLSYWRNLGYSDQQIIAQIKQYFDSEQLLPHQTLSTVFADFLADLQTEKQRQHFITFDDMLFNLKMILENNPQALADLQHKYQYLFIDEFQDINPLQQQIVQLICPPDKHDSAKSNCKLIIVGDDDQSIYYFRGAEPKYIKEFGETYQQTSIQLMQNFRSTPAIVACGNRLIACNQERIAKTMIPIKTQDHDCYAKKFPDDEAEAAWIAKKINQLAQQDALTGEKANYRETLVLYPTKVQLRSLLKQLTAANVPFVTQAGEDLLGIFGIKLFKQLFDLLQQLTVGTEKITALKKIIQQYAFYHYIKLETSHTFTTQLFAQPKFKVNEVLNFLVNEKKLNTQAQDQAKKFFKQIYRLFQGQTLNLAELAETLSATPKFSRELTAEEITWLKEELTELQTWEALTTSYQAAVTRNQKMKQRLADYDQNKLNAVYLLSIHASKGLGQKNVFVKGVYQDSLPNQHTSQKTPAELRQASQKANPATTLEEQRRLMYVAITRAKENLYVTFPQTVNQKPCRISPFIQEAGLNIKIAEK
ncbi:ATP-dependent helicase [Enterococcus sp. CSURQ0835]|uniref:ATP-dependent helicase n=1 Tax=Enterococcus sp. CSURQ0835 TaxID=2681394 RepID=UPI00135725D5|nr:ATP-dependent helicase [Enterococcus sp. CSURQ0835]